MIPTQARRAPHQGNQQSFHTAPNAALLIDFDNVTMGIRSDLGKELKSLLNSDVIRGKVAVQRAYADWRRYPQYIVPLAESSIDLIFAPAYGSSKKNATDLRMAIDAMELVFTRPEIGTFILMTGDSDFSSCVLKLKEYGKYVIGVGMRESSSDLLIQNCDEYYSYHSLSGLTRAGEVEESREDPWALVKRALQQMVSGGDVMRTDRLKQVMLDLDPAFDEKKLGYSKFSRFVNEAASKGLIRLRKGENGQYEISVDAAATPPAAPAKPAAPKPERTQAPAAEPAAEAVQGNGRRRRGRGGREEAQREPTAERETAPASSQPAASGAEVTELDGAYRLLQQAVRSLGGTDRKAIRDGDVKRRMLDLVPGFDEAALGFSKFTRFLRQAHDAEIIDLNRADGGNYEVSLSSSGPRLEPLTAAPAAPAPEVKEQKEAPRPAEKAPEAQAAPAPEPKQEEKPAATSRAGALRGRRGGRPGAAEGPPPLLPGQVVQLGGAAGPAEPKPAEAPAAEAVAEEPQAKKPTRRGRRGRGAKRDEAAPEPQAEKAVEAAAPEAAEQPKEEAPKKRRTRSRSKKKEEKPAAAIVPGEMGLPRGRAAVEAYLTNSYRGVGQKTAETLWKEFGPELFTTLQKEPDRVRSLLGARRANAVLEQWSEDYARRQGAPAAPAAEPAPEPEAKEAKPKTRRGSRGRGRKKQEAAPKG